MEDSSQARNTALNYLVPITLLYIQVSMQVDSGDDSSESEVSATN